MAIDESPRAWRRSAFYLLTLIGLTLGAYWETVEYLISIWNQYEIGEYGHGYLVLGISIYLIQRKFRSLPPVVPYVSAWGLLGIFAAGLLWFVSSVASVEMMQAVALWMMIIAIVWTILGGKVTIGFLFPLLFIIFALPIWFPLSPLLQELSADVVFWLLHLLKVPAYRQEALIVLPAGMLSIEEACSGLRYLLAALTLGTLYAYLNYSSFTKRLIVVSVSAVAAISLNFVRVFIVIYLAYLTEMQHPYVHDHLMLGWYLFGGMMLILLVVDARLSKTSTDEGGDLDRVVRPDASAGRDRMHPWLAFTLSALLISAAPAAVYKMHSAVSADYTQRELPVPEGMDGWSGEVNQYDDWLPIYHGAQTVRHSYEKNAQRVHLFIGHYPRQQQGIELINDLNRISDSKRWRNVYPRGRVHETPKFRVLEQVLEKGGGEERLVWYWYRVAGIHTVSKYQAKLLQILGSLIGQPQATVIAVATKMDDLPAARKRLAKFITVMGPSLQVVSDQGD